MDFLLRFTDGEKSEGKEGVQSVTELKGKWDYKCLYESHGGRVLHLQLTY